MRDPRLAARETLADRLQMKWLRNEDGFADPCVFLGVDAFTVFVRTLCSPSE